MFPKEAALSRQVAQRRVGTEVYLPDDFGGESVFCALTSFLNRIPEIASPVHRHVQTNRTR